MKRTPVFVLALSAMLARFLSPTMGSYAVAFATEKEFPAEVTAVIKDMEALLDSIKSEVAGLTAALDNAGPMVGIGILFGPKLWWNSDVSEKYMAEVRGVIKGKPAEKAGIVKGDMLLSVNGKVVAASDDVINEIRGDGQPGRLATLELDRNGTKLTVAVSTAVLRPDKTAEAKKMRGAIERESAAHVVAFKNAADAIANGLEDGSLPVKDFEDKDSTDLRVLAYYKAMADYDVWAAKKSQEIKKLLDTE